MLSLANPNSTVKWPRQSKWQIDAAQWSPHHANATSFVTSCNQRADLWKWQDPTFKQQGSMRAHTRVISDIDWSPFDPNTLATCSVDTFTHGWDVRDLRKPKFSLQGIAGVTQAKWNKVNSHVLATCHDGDIRVWDERKTSQPMQYIAAHASKIHGLDWSPTEESELASSSQDCCVKFWNINEPRQAIDKMGPFRAPVWRARYTVNRQHTHSSLYLHYCIFSGFCSLIFQPFGKSIVTVEVPQLRRGMSPR